MALDIYWHRRLVSLIAFHANKGRSWEEIRPMLLARKDKFTCADVDACRAEGFQAVRNAELIGVELQRRREARESAAKAGNPPPDFPPLRLCDIAGCKFPGVTRNG